MYYSWVVYLLAEVILSKVTSSDAYLAKVIMSDTNRAMVFLRAIESVKLHLGNLQVNKRTVS